MTLRRGNVYGRAGEPPRAPCTQRHYTLDGSFVDVPMPGHPEYEGPPEADGQSAEVIPLPGTPLSPGMLIAELVGVERDVAHLACIAVFADGEVCLSHTQDFPAQAFALASVRLSALAVKKEGKD